MLARKIISFVCSILACSAVFAEEETAAWRSPEEQRQIDVYKKTNEAVVFITTISLALDPNEMTFSLQPRQGTGSGCIVDAKRGLILTNLHVIRDAQRIEVTFGDGQTSPAQRLGVDEETDLAVIQVQRIPPGLPTFDFGDSSKLDVGQRVLAIGNPFGLNRTLTIGIISSLDRTVKVSDSRNLKGLIQIDAAINPGNSGGALIDLNGRLIGVNSAILSSSGDSAGIGFAIPINQIKRVITDLVTKGHVLRPRFGWALLDTNQGPFVERVVPGSPADEAGVQPALRRVEQAFLTAYIRDYSRADLVVAVNGKRVSNRDEIEDIISELDPEKPITFSMKRGGIKGKARDVVIKPVLR